MPVKARTMVAFPFPIRAVLLTVWALSAFVPTTAAAVALTAGGGEIRVEIADGDYAVSRGEILDWVSEAAHAVTTYYGRFPVDHLTVEVPLRERGGIGGRTYGWKQTVVVPLGEGVTSDDLEDDWVMTHEMVHMAFPDVVDRHKWIKEGLSTYVQRIARVQIGNQDATAMWRGLMRKLPQGLPRHGDQGLDNTHTWGRTYWGGALFCFLADVEIRRRTDNRYGLQDALRAIVNAGGTLDRHWSIERALRIGDRAVGVPVLMELYQRMGDAPYTPNLDELWRQLGVERTEAGVVLNDDAPLAAARQAIVAAPSASG